ncbi:hypothetical protein L195_g051925, partial [Trifolium pratense]
LFKVRKVYGCDSCSSITLEVLDILIGDNLLDIYYNPRHILYDGNEFLDGSLKPYVSLSQELTRVSSGHVIPEVIVPFIQSSLPSNCPVLDDFIGNIGVMRLSDLGNLKDDSVAIIVGWYDSVFEGIDLWYPDEKDTNHPRFRLKIKVGDETRVDVFVLFDEDVKRVGFETCALLASIGENATMYPNEMDVFYGDPMLFKVLKKAGDVAEGSKIYEIVGM